MESVLIEELDLLLKAHFGIDRIDKVHVQMFVAERFASGDDSFITGRLREFSNRVFDWASGALLKSV